MSAARPIATADFVTSRARRAPVKSLYVTGGRHKPVGLRAREEWATFEKGVILRLDPARGSVDRIVQYTTPEGACPKDGSISFEGGVLQGDLLYVSTRTEALVYQIPKFKLLKYVSLPCFNDVHHVRPTEAGNLIVTSTGLDMVVEVALDGTILNEWDVLGEPVWTRFSRDVDYRQVLSTKPHHSHPNYTFFLNGELWVTRGIQKDAACLTTPGPQISVGAEFCHDGEVRNGSIYFTTVNGTIVIVNANTLEYERTVDLNKVDNPGNSNLGWCRGLGIVDESRLWVGFSRFRQTKFKENVRWVKRFIKGEEKPTHIALYDISAKKRLAEIDLEPYGMHAIFGIFSTDIG
jgi:hypothetical protein